MLMYICTRFQVITSEKLYVYLYLNKIPGYHIREIKCTYSNGYTAVNTLQLTNKQMHLFTKIPLFISCRHNATLQGNTSQLNKQMPGLFTICFNPSLNAEAIMSNAPNKHLHLLAIAALHLTPHVLQWPNDPPGQGGRDARCQQWADQRPLELFREVPSA